MFYKIFSMLIFLSLCFTKYFYVFNTMFYKIFLHFILYKLITIKDIPLNKIFQGGLRQITIKITLCWCAITNLQKMKRG